MVRVGVRVPRKVGQDCSILPQTVLLNANVNYSYLHSTRQTSYLKFNFTKTDQQTCKYIQKPDNSPGPID